jgi:tetratricopeptide (TPR) repeat protein
MVDHPIIIKSLKAKLPETSWSWIIPALHHDLHVWGALQEKEFLDQAIASFTRLEDWTPASMGYLAIDTPRPKLDAPLEPELSHRAAHELEKFVRDASTHLSNYPVDLGKATLMATAMAEQRLRSGSWKQPISLLLSTPLDNEAVNSVWKTCLAVLLGLSADRVEFLRCLVGSDSSSALVSLGLHAHLSNPELPVHSEKILKSLLEELPLSSCARLLRKLYRHKPEEATRLSRWLLNTRFPTGSFNNFHHHDEALDHLVQELSLAEILSLAGRCEVAEVYFLSALDHKDQVNAGITAHIVRDSLQREGVEAGKRAWERVINQPEPKPPYSLLLSLSTTNMEEAFSTLGDTETGSSSSARIFLEAYRAAQQDRISEARYLAFQALQTLQGEAVDSRLGDGDDLFAILSWMSSFLLDLSYPEAAYRAAQLASRIKPEDPGILRTFSMAARLAGDVNAAVTAAQMAVVYQPTDPQLRRELAVCLEASGQWEASLTERESLVDKRFAPPTDSNWPPPSDWRDLATCAAQAGDLNKARQACLRALEMSPEDGLTQGVLGEILFAIGEGEQAMDHLRLATQQAPEQPQPWLSLAKSLYHSDRREEAIETLRLASHTVEDDPSIHLALGELFLEDNAFAQAEENLRQAFDRVGMLDKNRLREQPFGANRTNRIQTGIQPEIRSRIAYLYGLTLYRLGHLDHAKKILADAYQVHSSYPGTAYTYGRVLLESGDLRKAIAPLAVAVSQNPIESAPYIDYAFTLLELRESPGTAVDTLKKALIQSEGRRDDKAGDGVESILIGHGESPSPIFQPDWSSGWVGRNLANRFSNSRDDGLPRAVTIALLAEAFEASGEHDSAIRSYSQALETVIAEDDEWKIRLSLGMARVALVLHQPEIAIAALEEIGKGDNCEVGVFQILCEAYAAIELFEEALQAGKRAILLAPEDVDILGWYSEKQLKFGSLDESVRALERAVELDRRRIDLALKLAEIYLRTEKKEAAHEIFHQVLASPYANPDNLYQAAASLSNLGDREAAIQSLERALELQPEPPLELLKELSSAYRKSGDLELALRTIDVAIENFGDIYSLHATKADLLIGLERYQAAQACLEHALRLAPHDPTLHYKMATLFVSQGDLELAHYHSQIMIAELEPDAKDTFVMTACELAASVAWATLDTDTAHAILASPLLAKAEHVDLDESPSDDSIINLFCLSAELSLENDEEISAAKALTRIVQQANNHPRVQALQARLAYRQGDTPSALQFLEKSLLGMAPDREVPHDQARGAAQAGCGIALAAIDLGLWEKAIEQSTIAVSFVDYLPHPYLLAARAITQRAEYQRLCQSLNVVNHAPGQGVLSDDCYQTAKTFLKSASDHLPNESKLSPPLLLKRWEARCQAVFRPGPDSIQDLNQLPSNPTDRAALIPALNQTGDLIAISQVYKSIQSQGSQRSLPHIFQAQYAIAMGLQGRRLNDLEESLAAAQSAIEQQPNQPLYYSILARLAQSSGDLQTASSSIETALTFWPDEPRWQAMAANLSLAAGDAVSGIAHLDEAIALEPKHLPHHLALGDAHLRIGHPEQAIQALKQALEIAPGQLEAYMALASAQLASEKMSDAARNAEKAIAIAPDQLPPLLLRAEIALRMDEPERAKEFAEMAVDLKPEDSTAHHLLARALNKLGRADESMSVIENALPHASDPLPLLLERARLIGFSHGDEAAYSALQDLIVKYPDEPAVLATYAKNLANTGKPDEAIRAAQRALRNGNGHLTPDERADLHHLLGRLLRRHGQLDQAVHQFSEATRMDPYDLESYLDLGDTLQERRQHGKALEIYRKAISIAPGDPRPYHQAGLVLRESHDYQGAESMFRRAADLAPKDINIHRQLAALVALNLVHNNQ